MEISKSLKPLSSTNISKNIEIYILINNRVYCMMYFVMHLDYPIKM